MNTSNTPAIRPYCCDNCPHFFDIGELARTQRFDDAGRSVTHFHRTEGECRYSPPAMFEYGGSAKWPKVFPSSFCSRHPSAPMDRTEQLLARIAAHLEKTPEERVVRDMRAAPGPHQPVWMNTGR